MLTIFVSVLTVIVASIDTSTLLVSGTTDRDDQLYFSLIVSGAPTLNNVRVVSAVNKALELIENDSTILSGYHLSYSHVLDAQVSCSYIYSCFVHFCNNLKATVWLLVLSMLVGAVNRP